MTHGGPDPWQALLRPDVSSKDIEASLDVLGLPSTQRPDRAERIADTERTECFEANVAALRERAAVSIDDINVMHAAIRTSIESQEFLRSADNEIVCRPTASVDPSTWSRRRPLRKLAAEAIRAETDDLQRLSPVLVIGLATPWSIEAAEAMACAREGGLAKLRCFFVHHDVASLSIALSMTNIAHAIARDTFSFYIGNRAIDKLGDALASRPETLLPASAVVTPTEEIDQEFVSSVVQRLKDEHQAQHLATAQSTKRGRDFYSDRSINGLTTMLNEAAEGDRTLRILLPTSLKTTYVRHSVEDLAEALTAMGHTTHVLTEGDAATGQSAFALASAIEQFRPDVVVSANVPRGCLPDVFPPQLPFVCWVQDALGHLFDEDIGRRQGQTDITIGNTPPELFSRFGYPAKRACPYPAPASSRKFHRGMIDDAMRERFACDIAFVSHHGEPPAAMRDRLATRLGLTPQLSNAGFDAAADLAAHAHDTTITGRLMASTADCCRSAIGRPLPAKHASLLAYQFILPIAGRIFRHQAIDWTIDIAKRRGWSLKLFGRDWERVEKFAPFAAGAVSHGDELRACYALAKAHLHIDLATMTHQRVFECVFSGGLPVLAYHADALEVPLICAIDELLETRNPQAVDKASGDRYFDPQHGPRGQALALQREQLGLSPLGPIRVPGHVKPMGAIYRERYVPPFDITHLLGSLKDTVFTDTASLERILEHAIGNADWREATSSRIAERGHEWLSTEAFAHRLLEHAADAISDRCGWTGLGSSWRPDPERPDTSCRPKLIATSPSGAVA